MSLFAEIWGNLEPGDFCGQFLMKQEIKRRFYRALVIRLLLNLLNLSYLGGLILSERGLVSREPRVEDRFVDSFTDCSYFCYGLSVDTFWPLAAKIHDMAICNSDTLLHFVYKYVYTPEPKFGIQIFPICVLTAAYNILLMNMEIGEAVYST